MGKQNFIFGQFSHYKALLFRRFTVYRRTYKSLLKSCLGVVIFAAIGAILQGMMINTSESQVEATTYKSLDKNKNTFLYVGKNDTSFAQDIMNEIKFQYKNDTDKESKSIYYNSLEEMNEEIFKQVEEKNCKLNVPFGIYFKDTTEFPYSLTILYNSSVHDDTQVISNSLISNILYQKELGEKSTFDCRFMGMNLKFQQMIFSLLGPTIMIFGLLTITSLIVPQPIDDIRGEVRSFMIQCNLKLLPYWLSNMTVDLILWVIFCLITYVIYLMGKIAPVLDNAGSCFYILFFQGPSLILFLYDFSFLFEQSNSASRQIFLISICILVIPIVVNMFASESAVLDWIYSLIPHISLYQLLGKTLPNTGARARSLSYYWKKSNTFPYFLMQFIDIFIYGLILYLIEKFRNGLQKKQAQNTYESYIEFLRELKERHETSKETQEMEEEVMSNGSNFAVKVKCVSRLFINTAGQPVPAVNCVTLGVKEKSIFGFLGANGAGKTTLIRMITGSLPCSDGVIEIFGKNIEDIEDKTIISICPQFNNHLFFELTTREHFKFYSLLFELNKTESEETSRRLIEGMELTDMMDKPIKELSGGDARKLAIALSFFGPSKIVLLDEPTANLDPVACKCVHQMILNNKGDKTFMLCTHLLSEAEELCDLISIMVKGNVFTVGTPQFLTKNFGTDYKIDIKMKDETTESENRCNRFFLNEFPEAALSMKRMNSRIYSLPSNSMKLSELFTKMQKGLDGDCGFSYYTCSTSSLERVFMEIVHKSELEEMEVLNQFNRQQSSRNLSNPSQSSLFASLSKNELDPEGMNSGLL